jgi:hypothetical protein
VQGLQNQAQANLHDYQQAIAENDMNAAAWAESEYRKNTGELAEMTGGQAAQQQQAQPAQQQFSEAEREWINRNANVCADPRKWNECIAAANSLIARGYDRNSPEYINAIEMAVGLVGPDGKEGNEIISPNQVVEICKITPDQYREGAAKLAEMKRQGFYKVD